jgi:serine/threonine protein kinase/TolB-like protein/Flp pilus assembly protein TadD
MSSDRWQEVDRLCLAALERDPAARSAFLDEACAGDLHLRGEVESLLAAQCIGDAVLAVPAIEAAAKALTAVDDESVAGAAAVGSSPPADGLLSSGTRLGPYELDRLIAAGGMGQVYRALDTRLGREVAVKVLPQDVAADPERLHRFQLEARAVAALNHSNIVAIYDVGVSQAVPSTTSDVTGSEGSRPVHYLVTELLQGQTLRERIANGRLPLCDGLDIALQIAAALAAAHGKQVVHRDLKPSNVFVTADRQAKLLDFGIAKVVVTSGDERIDHAATGFPVAETGPRMGTIGYSSPEQVRGDPTDARSDIFSFGALLYEMLTGRRAFGGDTAADTPSAILEQDPPPLADYCDEAPAALRHIVSRCLAKNPDDRFQSADALAVELGVVSRALVEPRRMRRLVVPALVLLVLVTAGVAVYMARSPTASHTAAAVRKYPRTTIAVMPLQNFSADGAYGYHAGALHAELMNQLLKVATLKVIGRASVTHYQPTTEPPLRRVAEELGAGSVVEGSVQVEGRRLRVSVNLVDAVTNQVLWNGRYDRTVDDAFAIQSEIAQKVAAGVGVVLSSDDQARLAALPTTNPEAYRFYLQGLEYWNRLGGLRANYQIAEQLFEKALHEDPGFALAHAALSRVHGVIHWFRYDPSPARAVREREEAETALRLAPDLPQAHHALGLARYHGRLDYRGALDEFMIAQRDLPNDAELLMDIGFANRRLGRWSAAIAAYERVIELDPRNTLNFYDLGGETFTLLHRYADAVSAYSLALSLAPDLYEAAYRRAYAYLLWQGRLEPLRDALNHLPEGTTFGASGTVAGQRAAWLLLERDAAGLLLVPEVGRATDFEASIFFLPSALYRGWAHQMRGDAASAHDAFGAAVSRLDVAVRELPNDWRVHAARGLALAGAGRPDDAVAEASWLQQCEVYRNDAHYGTIAAEFRAQILAQSGRADRALDEVERLLTGPSWLSVHTLRLDPRWDPIRAHPRFEALLRKFSS